MTEQEFIQKMAKYKQTAFEVAIKEISFLMGQIFVRGYVDLEIICSKQKCYSVYFPIELNESVCVQCRNDDLDGRSWRLVYWDSQKHYFVPLVAVSDILSIGQTSNILASAFISFYEKSCLSKLKEENNNE